MHTLFSRQEASSSLVAIVTVFKGIDFVAVRAAGNRESQIVPCEQHVRTFVNLLIVYRIWVFGNNPFSSETLTTTLIYYFLLF